MNNLSASVTVTAPFHDVDQLGIVWHGHYIKYFEIARCELLKTFQYDYPQMSESGYVWPIVDVQVKYVGSVYYDQTVTVVATLKEYENRLRINYQILDQNNKLLTKGQTTQVCINKETKELEFCSPDILINNVESAQESKS